METSRSPRKVLRFAYRLGRRVLPDHAATFSRHDFTRAQLFACLVLREFFGLSYRRTEALLADSPAWLADIGLSVAPDHNTLWRALGRIVAPGRVNRMLDRLAASFTRARLLRLGHKPLALDSTCFEQRHRSAHYDRRCRRMAADDAAAATVKRPGKWGKTVNAARARRLRAMPKLSIAVAGSCHLILAAVVRTGNGSDAPDFDDLLFRSWKRADVRVAVADAGYDSEANHEIARQDLGVRSIIPPGIGRPTGKLPSGRWRRHMKKRFARKADQKQYAQRSQSETVHSMIKRNQGSALRSRTPERRKQEMLLRVLTHNIMLACEQDIDV
jgi:hypothetical protein